MRLRAQIGIDIASTEVRGVSVRAAGSEYQVAAVASAPIPPGALDPDGSPDARVLADVVRQVVARLDAKASAVVLGASSCSLVARVMEIPPVPDSEIRSVLRGEMDHFRILPAGQSAFDFHRMPEPARTSEDQPEEPICRVLLMGAEERSISLLRDAVAATGLTLVAIEPGSVAMLRACAPALRAEDTVATVMMGPARTDIYVTEHGALSFYRQIETGVDDLRTASLGARPNEPNRQPLGGLLVLSDDSDDDTAPAPGAPNPLAGYNRQAVQLLMTEIERSIEYFMRESPQAPETIRVQFAIDTPDAADLLALFRQHLSFSAELVELHKLIGAAPELAVDLTRPESERFLAAVGLALRGAPGCYSAAPMLDLGVADRVVVEGRVAPRFLAASFAVSGLVLVGTVVAAILVGNMTMRAEQTLKQKKTELSAVTQQHAELVAQMDRQKNLATAMQQRNRPIKEAVEFLAGAVSPRACLKSLSVRKDGAIFLSGEAMSPRIVADMMDMINLSPAVEPVRLTSLTSASVSGGSSLRFELQTAFATKPPITTAAASSAKPTLGAGGS